MGMIDIDALDIDTNERLNPIVGLDGKVVGTSPIMVENVKKGGHTVSFQNLPTYICLTPTIFVQLLSDDATAIAHGQYRQKK